MEEYSNRKSHLLVYAALVISALALVFVFIIAVIALGVGGKAYSLANDSSSPSSSSSVAVSMPVMTSLSATAPSDSVFLGSTVVSNWNTKLAPLTFARSDHSAVTIGNGIYVIGGTGTNGEGGTPTTNVTEMYSPVSNTWARMSPLQQARYRFAATAIGTNIYVTGGRVRDDNNALASLEVYDSIADVWTYKTPMPYGRSDHTSFEINGTLYLAGGYDGNYNILNTTLAYNPATDSWTEMAPLNYARGDVVGVSYNGKGFLTGGWGYPDFVLMNTLEEFDPAANTWTVKEGFLPDLGGDKGYEVINGQFIVIGGEGDESGDSKPLQAVDLYDMTTGIWTTRTPLPYPSLRMACSAWTNTSSSPQQQTFVFCFGGEECPAGYNLACLLDGPTAVAKDIASSAAYTEYTVYTYAPLS